MAYIGVDKERYDAGNRFLSQDRYLANYNPRDAITFNVSPNNNLGIMGQYPYPLIPQEGGDGGGGGINPNRTDPNFDYETDAYGLKDLSLKDKNITEEEQKLLNQMRFGKPLTAMQVLGIGMNPIGGGIRAIIKNRQQKKDAEQQLSELSGEAFDARVANITRGYGGGDDSDRPTTGPTAAGAGMGVGGGYASDYQGETSSSSTSNDSPAYDYAYGGRAGYSRGKLVEGIMSFFKPSKRAINYTGFRSRKDIPLEQYSKMEAPITTKIMEEIPESELRKIFRTQELGLYSETPEILKAGNLMQRFTKVVNGKRVIDYDRAEDILNVKLRGDETLDELFKIEFKTRPVERAYGGIVGMYR